MIQSMYPTSICVNDWIDSNGIFKIHKAGQVLLGLGAFYTDTVKNIKDPTNAEFVRSNIFKTTSPPPPPPPPPPVRGQFPPHPTQECSYHVGEDFQTPLQPPECFAADYTRVSYATLRVSYW